MSKTLKPHLLLESRHNALLIRHTEPLTSNEISHLQSIINYGVDLIIYDFESSENIRDANKIIQICKNNKIPFIVKSKIEIAMEIGADGIHIEAKEIPIIQKARLIIGDSKIVGVSVGNYSQAEIAWRSGADYLSPSPVFRIPSLGYGKMAVGLELIKTINHNLDIPQYPFGGINPLNMEMVYKSGAYGVIIDYGTYSDPQNRDLVRN